MSVISRTLATLTRLELFQLVKNPIGDDGFKQLAATLRLMPTLRCLRLVDIGLTSQSLAAMEKVVDDLPWLDYLCWITKRSAFIPADGDADAISQMLSLQWSKAELKKFSEPEFFLGYSVTEELRCRNAHNQRLELRFFR